MIPSFKLIQGRDFPKGFLLNVFVDSESRLYISIAQVGVSVVDLKHKCTLGLMTTAAGIPGTAVPVGHKCPKAH